MPLDLEDKGYEYGGDMAARYPRYRAAYDGFTPYTFVVQHGVKDFT